MSTRTRKPTSEYSLLPCSVRMLHRGHTTILVREATIINTNANRSSCRTTYRSHKIAAGDLEGYLDFKDGYKKIRNLQDMTRENATDLKDRLQKDYKEHGIRGTARTTVASSARSRSAPQSMGSGGSVQPSPVRSQATAQLGKSPLSTPGASGPASNSGSRVAQLKLAPCLPSPSRMRPRLLGRLEVRRGV